MEQEEALPLLCAKPAPPATLEGPPFRGSPPPQLACFNPWPLAEGVQYDSPNSEALRQARNLPGKATASQKPSPSILTYHLAKGLIIWGWSQMKVGLMQETSKHSPTS